MNEVSALTLKWYEETVKGRVLPYWGARRLDKFTPASVDEFKAMLLGEKISPRTVNVVLMRLREMLRLAYERDW
jgi:hypothetical protein